MAKEYATGDNINPEKPFDHVYLHVDELAELLGVDGEVMNVWMENDTRFIHVTAIGEGPNALPTARGGYVDVRHFQSDRIPRA